MTSAVISGLLAANVTDHRESFALEFCGVKQNHQTPIGKESTSALSRVRFN